MLIAITQFLRAMVQQGGAIVTRTTFSITQPRNFSIAAKWTNSWTQNALARPPSPVTIYVVRQALQQAQRLQPQAPPQLLAPQLLAQQLPPQRHKLSLNIVIPSACGVKRRAARKMDQSTLGVAFPVERRFVMVCRAGVIAMAMRSLMRMKSVLTAGKTSMG